MGGRQGQVGQGGSILCTGDFVCFQRLHGASRDPTDTGLDRWHPTWTTDDLLDIDPSLVQCLVSLVGTSGDLGDRKLCITNLPMHHTLLNALTVTVYGVVKVLPELSEKMSPGGYVLIPLRLENGASLHIGLDFPLHIGLAFASTRHGP